MATVAELIELLKGGKITKEEMLERVSTPVYTQSSLNEKTLTGNRYSGVETVPDLTQISAYPDHAPDTEAEYDPQVFLHEIEDFYPRRPPSMTTKDYSDSSSSNFLNRQVQ